MGSENQMTLDAFATHEYSSLYIQVCLFKLHVSMLHASLGPHVLSYAVQVFTWMTSRRCIWWRARLIFGAWLILIWCMWNNIYSSWHRSVRTIWHRYDTIAPVGIPLLRLSASSCSMHKAVGVKVGLHMVLSEPWALKLQNHNQIDCTFKFHWSNHKLSREKQPLKSWSNRLSKVLWFSFVNDLSIIHLVRAYFQVEGGQEFDTCGAWFMAHAPCKPVFLQCSHLACRVPKDSLFGS